MKIEHLKLLRNYFGQHSKTCHEHYLFAIVDEEINRLSTIVQQSLKELKTPQQSDNSDYAKCSDLLEEAHAVLEEVASDHPICKKLAEHFA